MRLIESLLVAVVIGVPSPAVAESTLTLRQALPMEGAAGLEPSGLALCDGQLLMVSDNHGDRIFALRPDDDLVRAELHLEFDAGLPRGGLKEWLISLVRGPDFEGITCAGGHYWLASESYDAVLELAAAEPRWRHMELREAARAAGLFEKFNARLEGIAYYRGELWLAAEREPRGWLRLAEDGAVSADQAGDGQSLSDKLAADYAGLASTGEHLLALERNAWRVCLMDPDTLRARHCADFGAALREAGLTYATNKPFGIAEGIAADAERIWLVLDHGGAPRTADSGDTRSLLLEFHNPF